MKEGRSLVPTLRTPQSAKKGKSICRRSIRNGRGQRPLGLPERAVFMPSLRVSYAWTRMAKVGSTACSTALRDAAARWGLLDCALHSWCGALKVVSHDRVTGPQARFLSSEHALEAVVPVRVGPVWSDKTARLLLGSLARGDTPFPGPPETLVPQPQGPQL